MTSRAKGMFRPKYGFYTGTVVRIPRRRVGSCRQLVILKDGDKMPSYWAEAFWQKLTK